MELLFCLKCPLRAVEPLILQIGQLDGRAQERVEGAVNSGFIDLEMSLTSWLCQEKQTCSSTHSYKLCLIPATLQYSNLCEDF